MEEDFNRVTAQLPNEKSIIVTESKLMSRIIN